jgi:peptide/nickel transport system permease protein
VLKYVIKRLIWLIPVIICATLIVFLLMSVAQGDPARTLLGAEASQETVDKMREDMGLNDPILIQYARYMLNVCKGDLGTSYKSGSSCADEILARFPNTAKLAFVALILTVVLALPLGVIAAIRQNTFFDGFSMFISMLGMSMPVFWLGLLLMLVFSLKLGWLPVSGADSPSSIILPAVSLAFQSMASVARTTRSSMLEVVRQDYIRTARAKGLPEREVIVRHAVRNGLVPTVTVIGVQLGHLLGGSVLVETVFAWPGMGRLMIQSIQQRDIPMVLGCIIIFALIYALVNLLVDLIYAAVDPRMRTLFD